MVGGGVGGELSLLWMVLSGGELALLRLLLPVARDVRGIEKGIDVVLNCKIGHEAEVESEGWRFVVPVRSEWVGAGQWDCSIFYSFNPDWKSWKVGTLRDGWMLSISGGKNLS